MKEPILYKVVRPLLTVFIKLYRPTIIGKENLKMDDNYILVGNHTSYLDPLLVALSVKGCVHYFAKNSLYKGYKKHLFKRLGIIPVDRTKKDKNSLIKGIEALNNGHIIGIFPEGTINRTNDIIMPFKYGAVKMAYETNKGIVPFAIINEYKLFKKSVIIVYDKPYKVKSNDLEKENKILMNKVKNLIIRNGSENL